jgi:hypothetical protein
MKYELRFTVEQKEGIDKMYNYLYQNYAAIKEDGVGKKRLIGWMRFVGRLFNRKTYSKLHQSKLNEIREFIIKQQNDKTP